MPFAEVVELALYDPDFGFYSSTGHAGRRGDFITSPEVGPLFGHVVANAIDSEWDRLGRPDPFTVIDCGSGPGTLARGVRFAAPRCQAALRYVAVERSGAQRVQHPEHVVSVEEIPPELSEDGVVGVVIANELLDNMAFTPMRLVDGEAASAMVTIAGDEPRLTYVKNPDMQRAKIRYQSWVDQSAAAGFVAFVLKSVLRRGRLIVIDYARSRSDAVELRTYSLHGRAGDPLRHLGTKDITVDVDLEQLQQRTRDADSVMNQADWLKVHGIDSLVEEGQELWKASAAIGDLAAIRARSRVNEGQALMDPSGLGGFTVAEWLVDSV